MNSIHYDVIVFTGDMSKGVRLINELIQEHNESIYKHIESKYITDKRTYIIINPNKQVTRGLRYYEAYVDQDLTLRTYNNCILPYCLPHTDNWKERIHLF